MSNKQKYKPGVKITMNKFHKFWVGTTAIVSMFGWNVNIAQAQSLPAHCTGAAIGSLLGLAITGNARAAANAIPPECTTQNQNTSQSPAYSDDQKRVDTEAYIRAENLRNERIKRRNGWLTEPDNVPLSSGPNP
ncbi:MAG: hypothetical protein PT118_05705 [Aphanizomenon gracile PMC644.10]|nr:hypothetical protein [Aphanizomenon gracile PMC644.10]